MTNRFTSNCQRVESVASQIVGSVEQLTADGAYDKKPVYETLLVHFKNADIIIPSDSDAILVKITIHNITVIYKK